MHNVMNYEEILKANARQKVALEVLSFHASSSHEEAERIMVRSLIACTTYGHGCSRELLLKSVFYCHQV